MMAALVYGQRGKLRQSELSSMRQKHGDTIAKLLAIMRIAVVLKWAEGIRDAKITATAATLNLCFPKEWQERHPLTTKELTVVSNATRKLGVQLRLT